MHRPTLCQVPLAFSLLTSMSLFPFRPCVGLAQQLHLTRFPSFSIVFPRSISLFCRRPEPV